MPLFRYAAIDELGQPASGQLEAPGAQEALAELTARGLRLTAADVVEVAESAAPEPVPPEPAAGSRPLSGNELVELAGGVAGLARAQLPMAPGLRAMALELGDRRLSATLNAVADRLDAGLLLDDALAAERPRLPEHVRALFRVGLERGCLAEMLEEYVSVERYRQEVRWRILLVLAYPGVLMGVLLLLMLLLNVFLIAPFEEVYGQFETDLPTLTQSVFWMSRVGGWVLLAAAALLTAGIWLSAVSPWPLWPRRLMYRVPLVGPIWRYGGLAELFRLMTLLVKRQVPLPEALRWTAGSLRYPDLSKACRSVAAGVEAGSPLPECLARDRAFPATVVPVIAWGQQSSGLAAALQATAEMFESRARARHALLEAVLPTVILLFIGGTVLLVVSGLFLPLLSLIRALT